MENKKMTKKESFNELMNIVTSIDIDETKKDNLLSFIEHELDLLERKNTRKSDKPTKKQNENASFAKLVLSEMEEGTKYFPKELAESYGVSAQKLTAVLKQSFTDGMIFKGKEKGKIFYYVGNEPTEGE
jgi:hypothetical protein